MQRSHNGHRLANEYSNAGSSCRRTSNTKLVARLASDSEKYRLGVDTYATLPLHVLISSATEGAGDRSGHRQTTATVHRQTTAMVHQAVTATSSNISTQWGGQWRQIAVSRHFIVIRQRNTRMAVTLMSDVGWCRHSAQERTCGPYQAVPRSCRQSTSTGSSRRSAQRRGQPLFKQKRKMPISPTSRAASNGGQQGVVPQACATETERSTSFCDAAHCKPELPRLSPTYADTRQVQMLFQRTCHTLPLARHPPAGNSSACPSSGLQVQLPEASTTATGCRQ